MKRDYQLALLAATATMLPGAILTALGLSSSIVVVVTVGGAVAATVTLDRRWYRQVIARIDSQATHLRSAVSITAGGMPIFWSEHAIAPETLAVVQHLITSLKAQRVLELGSGVSTLLIAHAFRRAGAGRIVSLDDDSRWAAATADSLRRENLQDFAEVRVAPLVEIEAGGRRAPWYDLTGLDRTARFDIILVDARQPGAATAWRACPRSISWSAVCRRWASSCSMMRLATVSVRLPTSGSAISRICTSRWSTSAEGCSSRAAIVKRSSCCRTTADA